MGFSSFLTSWGTQDETNHLVAVSMFAIVVT